MIAPAQMKVAPNVMEQEVLTQAGKDLIDFLSPIIEAKAKDLAVLDFLNSAKK